LFFILMWVKLILDCGCYFIWIFIVIYFISDVFDVVSDFTIGI